MVVILKRGGILLLSLIMIVSFLIFSLWKGTRAEDDNIILIDAGHGGPDGGATGNVTGVLEKGLNLSIAKKVTEKLKQEGFNVLETRTEDVGLYEKESASLKEKKRADMKRRAELANGNGISLLLSIHMNHFSDPKYSGPQVFYQKGSEEGRRLAEEIRAGFLEEIGPHCTRETKPRDDLYILRNTRVPAVIIECGFLSNQKEEALLQDEAYQEKIASAILNSVIRFKGKA